MHPPLNHLNPRPLALSYENWLGMLQKMLPERPNFSIENGTIQIGQVVGIFLGIPFDTDEYYNQLFEYVHTPDLNLQLLSDDSLDKSINNKSDRSHVVL